MIGLYNFVSINLPTVSIVVDCVNQLTIVIIFISAVLGITENHPVQVHKGLHSDNVTLEFSSVNRYNNVTYTVNFTSAIGYGLVGLPN